MNIIQTQCPEAIGETASGLNFYILRFYEFLWDKVVIKHYFRMIIEYELSVYNTARCLVDRLLVYLRHAVVLLAFLAEAMTFLFKLEALWEFLFAARLSVEVVIITPEQELHILVGIVPESVVYVIIAY